MDTSQLQVHVTRLRAAAASVAMEQTDRLLSGLSLQLFAPSSALGLTLFCLWLNARWIVVVSVQPLYQTVLVGTLGGSEVLTGLTLVHYAHLLKLLHPGGRLLVHSPDVLPPNIASTLTLAGFVDISAAVTVSGGAWEMTCRKPDFETGSLVALNLPRASSKQPPSAPDAKKIWKLSAEDFGDDVDFLDNDGEGLLDAADLAMATTAPPRDDCEIGVGGNRKACKDCTCGRAADEQLDTTTAVTAATPAKKAAPVAASSCGSCYLGDAFRCASCPYLGMPAFKPGDQITLSATQLKSDL